VRRALVALVITAAFVGATAGQAAARFPWTHRVTISGQFVDHWSVTTPGLCGTTGDGSVTVGFQNEKSIHVLVTRDRGRPRAWLLVGLTTGQFHQPTFLPPQPATGSITTVDNTSPANSTPDQPCDPIDKSHCGSAQLRRPRVYLEGLDASRLKFDLFTDDFRKTNCQTGAVTGFGDVDFFGQRAPELPVKMPSFRSFFRHRVVKVTGTSHDRKTFQGDPDSPATTDDVTRTVTVTFTKR
jgi:hypothetical protein